MRYSLVLLVIMVQISYAAPNDLTQFIQRPKTQRQHAPNPATTIKLKSLLARNLFARAKKTKSTVISTHHTGPLISKTFQLHFYKAGQLVNFLRQQKYLALPPSNTITIDKVHNTLWVSASTEKLTKLTKIIHQLDQAPAQITIKAKIVNIDRRYLRDLGVIFGTHNNGVSSDGYASDLPQLNTGIGKAIIPLARWQGNTVLNVELSALESRGHAKVIASPELTALDHHAAIIESGEEIPYQQRAYGGNTNVAFKKAVLRLKVIPDIISRKQILLKITLNQDKVSKLNINGVPAIRTQYLKTEAIVKPGATVVLGGIFEETDSQHQTGLPGLSQLPLLGRLFRQRQRIREHKMLLIFVTPQLAAATSKKTK
ncbi:MAG: secretin [Gammaproteobacteria bacterium]|nr:secretin [Gammaproteobacteria bacterium]